MRHYEFETRRWSRLRNDEVALECVVVSIRDGWTVRGYETRLYRQGLLLHRSRLQFTRRLADDEADMLLRETLSSALANNARCLEPARDVHVASDLPERSTDSAEKSWIPAR